MLERVYVEIGNICNLSCSFCAGTSRRKRQMSKDEFSLVCQRIKGHTKFIYLHVLGEPLLHPELDELLSIAKENSLKVCITTNGTLISEKQDILLKNSDVIHKICISLHAIEGNGLNVNLEYLNMIAKFSLSASQKGIYVIYRLWNKDGENIKGKNTQNDLIENFLKKNYGDDWQVRPRGYRLKQNIMLEYDQVFTWPTESKAEEIEEGFCYGLTTQLAVLVDGSVVPCCLDANGEITLGNIYIDDLDKILLSERATKIKDSFKSGKITEKLCKKCTFMRKFRKRNN